MITRFNFKLLFSNLVKVLKFGTSKRYKIEDFKLKTDFFKNIDINLMDFKKYPSDLKKISQRSCMNIMFFKKVYSVEFGYYEDNACSL